RVELRHARLRDAEHLADLTQRQLLVVVERDHELLPLGQRGDRLADQLPHLGRLELAAGTNGVWILERVDERNGVARSGRVRPELVERGYRRTGDVEKRLVELVLRDAELRGDLLVGRSPQQLGLELGDRLLDVTRARANGARDPVHRPELVDDRAPDARDRVRLEL